MKDSTNTKQRNQTGAPFPIVDLHCDLLHYLTVAPNADPNSKEDIGCAIPYLKDGNVKLQVMAICDSSSSSGVAGAKAQCLWFNRLLNEYGVAFDSISISDDLLHISRFPKTFIIASIENASCLCDEDESLDLAFERLEYFIKETKRLLYISLTHHGENRFGGGNSTDIGLKDDGRKLLDYINEKNDKNIAVDLSHTSDKLAFDIINHIDKSELNIPIMASHSNFRSIYNHPRNLPDELAREIIRRKGLIGMNFLRSFINPDDAGTLKKHILYGFEIAGEQAICFGADYFYTKWHPDKSRVPFFFSEHEHAGRYPQILALLDEDLSRTQQKDLAYRNACCFFDRIWQDD